MALDSGALALVAITLFAATVNGALGYGFSSLTVPVAVLFYANRVLNPALVIVEIIVNSYALFINRRSVPRVWKRTLPIIAGLVPGVVVGSFLLSTINPGAIKLVTYALLLPLILLQAGGVRRYIHPERPVGAPLGWGRGGLRRIGRSFDAGAVVFVFPGGLRALGLGGAPRASVVGAPAAAIDRALRGLFSPKRRRGGGVLGAPPPATH